MLPGKKYRPEDIVRLLRKRFWLLLVPFALVAALTAVLVHQMPDVYESSVTLLVVKPKIPVSLVPGSDDSNLQDRVRSIQQTVFSRPRLARIIEENNLYAGARANGALMEDVIARMRNDIGFTFTPGQGDSVRLSFYGGSPKLVQTVARQLGDLFIEENMKDRELSAENTTDFFEAEIADTLSRLQEREAKLRDFQVRNQGQLPSQLGGNLQQLGNIHAQQRASEQALDRLGQRRLTAQRELSQLEVAGATATTTTPPVAPSGDAGAYVGTTAQQLAQARAHVADLEARGMKDAHPELAYAKRQVADLEAKLQREALTRPVSSVEVARPEDQPRLRRIQELRTDIASIDLDMEREKAEQQRLRDQEAEVQARVDASPGLEAQLIELTRDYDSINGRYQALLNQAEQARMAVTVERKQIGEQFQIVDPANLPERPSYPNRVRYNAMGMVLGLGVGVVLIGFLEYRDRSFKTDVEVTTLLALPVLAVVPRMQSDRDQRRNWWRRWSLRLGLGAAVAACFTVIAYTLVR
ncbi:MAG: GNVR domain-containing protein [Vicinamibacterales bacterium]